MGMCPLYKSDDAYVDDGLEEPPEGWDMDGYSEKVDETEAYKDMLEQKLLFQAQKPDGDDVPEYWQGYTVTSFRGEFTNRPIGARIIHVQQLDRPMRFVATYESREKAEDAMWEHHGTTKGADASVTIISARFAVDADFETWEEREARAQAAKAEQDARLEAIRAAEQAAKEKAEAEARRKKEEEEAAAAAAAAALAAEEKARIEQAQQAATECLDQAVAFCVDEESKLVTELRGVIDQADIQTSVAKTMQKLSLMSKEELDDWVAKEMAGSPMAMMAKQLDQQTLLGFVKSDLEANPEKVDAAKAEFITLLKSQVKELGEKWEANQDELLEKVAKCLQDIPDNEAEIAAYKHLWAEGILQSTTCPPGFRIEQSDAVDARCKAGDHENGCLARIAMRCAPSAQSDTVSLIRQFEKAWQEKAN